MRTGDKEHRKLVSAAAKNKVRCQVCMRHCQPDIFRHLNPENLRRHLKGAHNYSHRPWWKFYIGR
jgi:hypothetical protein